MILDGRKFGETKRGLDGIIHWRCTANGFNEHLGRSTRCNVRLRTKLINGYEMLENTIMKEHNHQ